MEDSGYRSQNRLWPLTPKQVRRAAFPSPIGDGLIEAAWRLQFGHVGNVIFPSPIGDGLIEARWGRSVVSCMWFFPSPIGDGLIEAVHHDSQSAGSLPFRHRSVTASLKQ